MNTCGKKGAPDGSVVGDPLVHDGTRVRSLIQEDPTGLGAAEPVLQGPGAAAPEPTCPGARAPQQEKPPREKAGSAPGEQPLPPQPEGPAQPKINKTGLKNSTIHHTDNCQTPRAERTGLLEQQESEHDSDPCEVGTCPPTV